MSVFLIVGLGNPGREYEHTRHNVGFDVVDILAQKIGIRIQRLRGRALVGEGMYRGRRLVLARPQTFMNLSGESVVRLCAWYKPAAQDMAVVYDDADLPPGSVRVRAGGSAGTHNGMRSIISCLGRQDFPRVRVGIGAPPPQWEMADWVLSHYPDEAARKVAFDGYMTAADALLTLVEEGVEAAMRTFNRKPPKADASGPQAAAREDT